MGTQNQDQGKQQQGQGDPNRPTQQGTNQPGGRQQPGQDPGGQQGHRQHGGGSQAGKRQQEQQGDRERDRVAKEGGAGMDDIDERDDAGSLGQSGSQERKDKTR